MSTEDELHRIWGENYDRNMDAAIDAYDSLDSVGKQAFDRGDHRDFEALAAMRSPEYTNRKLPGHEQASKRVSDWFTKVYGTKRPFF